jgi:predicted Zn-dependent protease
MSAMKKDMHTNLQRKLALSTLLAGLLISSSLPTLAFDFKDALKDAVKQKMDEKGVTDSKDNGSANTNDQAKSAEPAKSTEPQINWKNPSKDEEIAIGREITGNLLGAAPLVKDEALQKYVNSVGRWVASQSERPDLPWHFGVIDSEDLNAFSAPGGYVVITKGMYRKFTNEAQLAGVLGHEIGHVVKKHQLKILQKQQLLNVGAGFLSDKLGKDNKLVSKAIGSGAEISARSLDKSAEFEADRLGMSYATRAGYDPYGLTDVLQTLSQTNKRDSSVALLFKTHPLPEDRLVAIGDAVGTKLDNVKAGKTLENRLYKLKN